jgi:hypothetical protein
MSSKRFRRGASLLAVVLLAAALSGCAPARFRLPTGPARPHPDYAALFQSASASCSAIRTLTAELRISGRVQRHRLRGTLLAGFETPGRLRLEGVAPFGPPAFILASDGFDATLLLPRDNRVLTGEPPSAVIEALAGIAVEPEDLRAILAGCVVPELRPVEGWDYPGGWVAVEVWPEATVFLRRVHGFWRIVAGIRKDLRIEYDEFVGGLPRVVRLEAVAPDAPEASLSVRVSQLQTNISIDQAAFMVRVPETAVPLTLSELREAGPLRGDEGAEGNRQAGSVSKARRD